MKKAILILITIIFFINIPFFSVMEATDPTEGELLFELTEYEGSLPADAIVQRWAMNVPSLHEAFSEHFLFGNILEPGELSNSSTIEMFLHQYNAVTAENAMKPGNVWRTKDSYDFTAADRLTNWAIENDITIHGHTLVWHSQSAPCKVIIGPAL